MKKRTRKWNQGNLEQCSFANQRQRVSRRLEIDAPVEVAFVRACLEQQPAWLPAGSTELSYSDSGGDEDGALWSDIATGALLFRRPDLQTFWMTTLLDRRRHRYQATLVVPELAVGTLDLQMEGQAATTTVTFELSVTALSEAGSALFDEAIGQRLQALLERFGESLASSLVTEPASRAPVAARQQRREIVEHETTINGDIDECFALGCPVAELLWIDGWKFDLVYSESGKNETGCVFLEPGSGRKMLGSPGANTYWYTTRFDVEQHRFDAIWLTRDLTIARWKVTMTDLGGGQTRVHWRLSYTGLGAEGNRLIGEPGLDLRMKMGLSFLATALKHYVESGSIYRFTIWRKLRLAASLVGASVSRYFRSSATRPRQPVFGGSPTSDILPRGR
jgi:hypothetical protein